MKNISVEEKIYLEKHLPHKSVDEIYGPSTDLFFHELVHDEELAQKYLTRLLGIIIFLFNLLLFPFLGLGLLFSGVTRVFEKEKCIGYRGKPIYLWKYRTRDSAGNFTGFGRFLYKSGLHKLPMSINLVKGDILLAGPRPLAEPDSFHWNNRFDEFYKRYAVKPGFFIIGKQEMELDEAAMASILKKEFQYLYKPSIRKDLQIILGRFSQ